MAAAARAEALEDSDGGSLDDDYFRRRELRELMLDPELRRSIAALDPESAHDLVSHDHRLRELLRARNKGLPPALWSRVADEAMEDARDWPPLDFGRARSADSATGRSRVSVFGIGPSAFGTLRQLRETRGGTRASDDGWDPMPDGSDGEPVLAEPYEAYVRRMARHRDEAEPTQVRGRVGFGIHLPETHDTTTPDVGTLLHRRGRDQQAYRRYAVAAAIVAATKAAEDAQANHLI